MGVKVIFIFDITHTMTFFFPFVSVNKIIANNFGDILKLRQGLKVYLHLWLVTTFDSIHNLKPKIMLRNE